eukprot:1184618-Prorocentrum_minimum.AAC.2
MSRKSAAGRQRAAGGGGCPPLHRVHPTYACDLPTYACALPTNVHHGCSHGPGLGDGGGGARALSTRANTVEARRIPSYQNENRRRRGGGTILNLPRVITCISGRGGGWF